MNTRRIQSLYESCRVLQDAGFNDIAISKGGFKLNELSYLMNKHKTNLEFPSKLTPYYNLNFTVNGVTMCLRSDRYRIVKYKSKDGERYYYEKYTKK